MADRRLRSRSLRPSSAVPWPHAAWCDSGPPMTVPCCKNQVTPADLLSACTDYWPAVNAVTFTCPACAKAGEVRLSPGVVWFGYTYGAGGVHFVAMIREGAPDLRVLRNSEKLVAFLERDEWHIDSK